MRLRDLTPEKQEEVKIFLGEKEKKSKARKTKKIVYINHI